VLIKAYPVEGFKDNKKLIKEIKNYQTTHSCCEKFPKCSHPHFQSDARLHRHFPELALSFFDTLKKYLKDVHSSKETEYTVLESRMWAFIQGAKTKPNWHQHATFMDNTLEISGLRYLTETKMGTVFDGEHLKIYLKPQVNTWFFWPSNLKHGAAITKKTKERITIAATIILKPISTKT
tara:strand:+ start:637 stop:1173 length:537 start_codon:yes stop_codon:yes gene_type:complete